MARDPEKARDRSRRYKKRKKVEKYGAAAADTDMRGRHGNHATGERNSRWNPDDRHLTSHGYIAVRVAVDHPHAWGSDRLRQFKYAYEHIVVMTESIGRPLEAGEVVHHRNGDKTDNRLENLQLTGAGDHQRGHAFMTRQRDARGKFV